MAIPIASSWCGPTIILKGGPAHEWTNPADFYDWRERSNTVEDMACFGQWAPTFTGRGEPEILSGMRLSYSMFAVLGVKPDLGRDFTAEDDRPNANHVVIVSHAFWESKFGGDFAALGQQLNLDGVGYSVVGVMPAGFSSPIIPNREIWSPLQAPSRGRGNAVLRVIGRLRMGTTLAAAQVEMTGIGEHLAQAYPETNKKLGIALVPLQEQISGDVRLPLLVLLAAVCLVLLIGCSNVANLLLACGTGRQREVSLRIALGAGQGRILRQLLTESCVLALIGGGAGLLLAQWTMRFLAAALPPSVTSVAPVRLDLPVLVFTLAISLVTGIAFGLLPALQVSRARLGEVLRNGGRSSTPGEGRHRLRIALVGADIALALALMVGAGLLLKSFLRLTSVNLGFRPDHLLSVNMFLPRTSYLEPQRVLGFYAQLLEKLSALPGVTDATAVSDPPLGFGGSDTSFLIEGRPVSSPADRSVAWYEEIPPNYHRVMGIPLLRGRAFNDRDTATAPKVILVNQSMAQRFWPDQDPIGKRIGQGDHGEPEWYEIVGVVGNIKFFGLDKEQPPCFYLPLAQDPQRAMTVMLRTAGPPVALASAVRSAVWSLDRNLAVPEISTMEQAVSNASGPARLISTITGAFAVIALLLAAIGLYGVMAYIVTERTHEIGIRMALGAARRDVLRMILGGALRMAMPGVGAGLAISFAMTRLLGQLLFGVKPTDPVTFIGVAVLLTLVALLASYGPARRAMCVDPMVALRYE